MDELILFIAGAAVVAVLYFFAPQIGKLTGNLINKWISPKPISLSQENIEKFKLLASQGKPEGFYGLGLVYETGTTDYPEDKEKALKYYKKAAEMNHATAMNNIGAIYDKYYNDIPESTKWYQKAAQAGDDMGCLNLGLCYYHGQGVEKDLRLSAWWLLKAAKAGNKKANYILYVTTDEELIKYRDEIIVGKWKPETE